MQPTAEELYQSLNTLMTEIIGWDYFDEDGYCAAARVLILRYQNSALPSESEPDRP